MHDMKARAIASAILASAPLLSTCWAMELKVAGNQLIMMDSVTGDELVRVQEILARYPQIDTVILRNSLGGDIPAGYAVGELFRARGLRTAVSGYCYSSCSRMFLGGKTRYFTDDYPFDFTNVGFHGHYQHGKLNVEVVQKYNLRDWIVKYSDGKADLALVERWINIPFSMGLIHFYHPQLFSQNGVATFMCQGTEPRGQSVTRCEPISRTALDLGIVTSLEVLKSADQAELRSRQTGVGFAPRRSEQRSPSH